ncbi:MAG: hypothetical protein GX442_21730 [Candidatus Riflebacteria bacterium]|nr:hypothetical protein [Candidatus Riflebacteria bacterium]
MAPGIGDKKWEMAHNENWSFHTRPFVDAYFHAQFFLAMAVKYGRKYRWRKRVPNVIPCGWGALMCLVGIW